MSELGDGSMQTVIRRTPRWMWAVLFLSLSVNLLIAGVVIGSLWAVKRGGYWDAAAKLERSYRFMSQLPEERRDEIRAVFHEYKPQLRPYWSDVRAARVEIGRMVRGGDYRREELDAAMDKLFREEAEARQATKPMLQDMLERLSPGEKMHFLRVFIPYLDDVQSRQEVGLPQSW